MTTASLTATSVVDQFDTNDISMQEDPSGRPGWTKAIDRLLEIRQYEDDWDGDGAVRPIPSIVDSAINLMRNQLFRKNAPAPSRIVAVNDGGVAIDWYFGGTYVSAKMSAPNAATCMVSFPDGTYKFSSWNW